jgi:hypothetical protein
LNLVSDRPGVFEVELDVTAFQKGNIHTHSTASDGDASPEAVYEWYRDHGYHFLGLSDHNVFVEPSRYRHLERPGFAIVAAEEVTMEGGGIPVHVNAVCHRSQIGGGQFGSVAEALRWSVARITEQGGIAMVNHPNYRWSFGAEALPDARGATLLEMWSGAPNVHTDGDTTHPSEEAIWTRALDQGLDFAGAAVDDTHHLGQLSDTSRAAPGRGWIEVFAPSATAHEICDALRRGRLYASTGPSFSRIAVRGASISVTAAASGGTVEFVGEGGQVLESQAIEGGRAHAYHLRGGEPYVRARLTAPDGKHAWTQAYRVAYR